MRKIQQTSYILLALGSEPYLFAVKNLSLHNTRKGELGHARGARAVAAAGVARDELRRNARPLGGNKNELVARVGKIRAAIDGGFGTAAPQKFLRKLADLIAHGHVGH